MALVWVATAPISVSPNVRAFNRNDIVPDSVVAALALSGTGLVVQREVDISTGGPSRGVDPVTQDELDALTSGSGRLSEAGLRAASVAAVEEAETVTPTGAWDFTEPPTVAGEVIGSGGALVPDATGTTKGKLRLAGDLGGTAETPTVPGLATKVDSDDPRLGASLQGSRPTDFSSNRAWGLLPGSIVTGAVATLTAGAVSSYYVPFVVDAPAGITLDEIQLEVTTAASAGATARLYIATANEDWEPVALAATITPLAIDSLGQKTATPAAALPRGRYLAVVSPTAQATFRALPIAPADGTWIAPAGWSATPVLNAAARSTSNPQTVPIYNAMTAGTAPGLLCPFISRWTVTPF